MADTTFVDGVLTAANRIVSAWLNAVNNVIYRGANPNYATTTGSANAQVLVLPAGTLYTTNAVGDTFTFKAGYTNTGATTLSVNASGGTNPACAVNGYAGALPAGAIVAGKIYTVTFNSGSIWSLYGQTGVGTMTANGALMSTAKLLGRTTASTGAVEEIAVSGDMLFASGGLSPYPQGTPGLRQNTAIAAVCTINRLVVALTDLLNVNISSTNPASLYFRSPTLTLGQGVRTTLTSGNLGIIVPDTALLGTVSGQASRIWVAVVYVSATSAEVAVYNALSGVNILPFNENALISTLAVGAGSNSAGVWYSTTALTSKPFFIVGYVESTQATAGTWATQPSAVVSNPVKRPGDVIQSLVTATGAVDSTATATPNDDTIPQYAEGKAFISVSVTPTFAGNLFRVDAMAQHAINVAASGIGFITKGATGGALAANMQYTPSAGNAAFWLGVSYTGVTAGVSSTSFEYVAGPESGTLTFNGVNATRTLGGVMTSRLLVQEIFV